MQIIPNELHIWSANLSITPEQEIKKIALLSSDECERAYRFHFQKDRQRFIAARSILREILSFYLEVLPKEIVFGYAKAAKPFLLAPNHIPLQFNLSHSSELALYAITLNQAIGVDIEKVQPDYNQGTAKRYFSLKEYNALMQLPSEERITGFYRIWSRKEALLKATGKGLTLPLSSFSVAAHDITELISLNQKETWTLLPLSIHDDYQSAVATNQPVKKISYWLNFEHNQP